MLELSEFDSIACNANFSNRKARMSFIVSINLCGTPQLSNAVSSRILSRLEVDELGSRLRSCREIASFVNRRRVSRTEGVKVSSSFRRIVEAP